MCCRGFHLFSGPLILDLGDTLGPCGGTVPLAPCVLMIEHMYGIVNAEMAWAVRGGSSASLRVNGLWASTLNVSVREGKRTYVEGFGLSCSSNSCTRGSKTSLNLGRRSSIHALVSSSWSGGSFIEPSLRMLIVQNRFPLCLRQSHSEWRTASMLDSILCLSVSNASNNLSLRSLSSSFDMKGNPSGVFPEGCRIPYTWVDPGSEQSIAVIKALAWHVGKGPSTPRRAIMRGWKKSWCRWLYRRNRMPRRLSELFVPDPWVDYFAEPWL